VTNLVVFCSEEDECVVGVLDDRARQVINKGVMQLRDRVDDEPVQEARHDQEEAGAQRISLPQVVAALNPGPRDALRQTVVMCTMKHDLL
jgi:hypothetical protein